MSNNEKIKNLREKTGISVMECKKALDESGGDEAQAMEWLRQRGVEIAEKKSSRGVKAGIIEAYIHANGRLGSILELKTETDFVAKNPAFKQLAHEIAMHIAASDPTDVKGLLEQPYIQNVSLAVSDHITAAVQKFGENIEVARFERFEI